MSISAALERRKGMERERDRQTARVNGHEMAYALHGLRTGTPLVMLYGVLIPNLSDRRIVAIEQPSPSSSSYRQMADDTAALLAHLAIERADFYGCGLGAAIALDIAVRRRGLVDTFVFGGADTSWSNDALRRVVSSDMIVIGDADKLLVRRTRRTNVVSIDRKRTARPSSDSFLRVA